MVTFIKGGIDLGACFSFRGVVQDYCGGKQSGIVLEK